MNAVQAASVVTANEQTNYRLGKDPPQWDREKSSAQSDLLVLDGEFRLKLISKPRGWPDVITVFMRPLTEN